MCASALLVFCTSALIVVCVCVCVCVYALLLMFSALQRCVPSPSEVGFCIFSYVCLNIASCVYIYIAKFCVVCVGGGVGGTCKHCHSEGQTNVVLACLWGMHGVIQACMEHS